MRTRLLPLLVVALTLPWARGDAADDFDPEVQLVVGKLAAGWAFLQAGGLSKAEQEFTEAYETRAGKDRADVYYSLAAVWWERRNAMASYSWLKEAEDARKASWYWDGGEEGEWDRRITGRIRYLERNFTVVKLRMPTNGNPLPPLADPPRQDPLLRSFADALAGQVAEGSAAGAGVQWYFLPNGDYWVAGELNHLAGGEMEPTRALSWQLSSDRGMARRKYDEAVAAIARREQEAEAQARAAAEARQRAWEQTSGDGASVAQVGSGQGQTGGNSVTDAGGEAVRALPTEPDPDQRPIAHRLVTWDTTREVSRDITTRWRGAGFHARYGVTCPNADAEHEIDFPDADFSVEFGSGGELKVRGAERLTEKLRRDWLVGEGELNLVELWYDGRKLLVVVNGVEFGPVTVRRGGDPADLIGRWNLTLSDARAEIQHLWIEPWDGSPR